MLLLLGASPAQAQLADAFAGHFGASRTYETGIRWSASLGVMLLTEFGSRWVPDGEVYWQYDSLRTTVGYNYLSGGAQRSWRVGPGGLAVLSGSLTAGFTSDRFTRAAQDALHDFRRFPHVQRGDVHDRAVLHGVELEAMYWWRFRPTLFGRAVDLDVHPHLGGVWSSYHREGSAGAAAGVGFWILRLQAGAFRGLLYDRAEIRPAAVARRLQDGYEKLDVSLFFDRSRYAPGARYFLSGGAALSWSSGVFIGQRERLLSLFVEFPVRSTRTVRFEFVNDLVNDKDRGPTGGLRLTYVAR